MLKKIFFFVSLIVTTTICFAKETTVLIPSTKVLNSLASERVCETRSGSVSNDITGECISFSCTQCSDTAENAAALAYVCVNRMNKAVSMLMRDPAQAQPE